jgi:arylsulfatase A-like enzyme
MRTLTSTLVGFAALLAAPPARADLHGTTDPLHPNILIIVADDVSIDKIGSYGVDFPTYAPTRRPLTSTIDLLASRGIRFTRAWSTPLCSSTRASLETGQQPHITGIGTALADSFAVNPPRGLDPANFTMLASSFAGAGYATGKFGKHHLGLEDAAGAVGYPAPGHFTVAPHPSRLGWQRYFGNLDGYPGVDPGAIDDGYFKWQRIDWLGGSNQGWYGTETVHATDKTQQIALNWITSRTQPFLALVTFNAGHSGTTASSTWTYDDVDDTKFRTPALSCLALGNCTPVGTPERMFAYQGLVEHMDMAIETLLAGIPQATLDNTLIVYLGDNGTPPVVQESAFVQSGRGKGSTYENGVRVPLIVTDGKAYRTGMVGPNIIAPLGRTVTAKVNTLDIYQTVHNVALNVSVFGVVSSSFVDCFDHNDVWCGWTGKRYGYTESFPSNASSSGGKAAVSYGEDTLVTTYNAGGACMTHEYYDTSVDPLELNPLPWTGIRATRLMDRFTLIHTGVADWANPTGAAVVPFCP